MTDVAPVPETETPAEEVVEPVDPTPAPDPVSAETPTAPTPDGTEVVSTDPTIPIVDSTSELDPTVPVEAATSSAPVTTEVSTPEPAPVVDPAPAQVIPRDLPSDTREVQAMKAAGTLAGLTDIALDALAELEKAHDAINGWLTYAKDQILKARSA